VVPRCSRYVEACIPVGAERSFDATVYFSRSRLAETGAVAAGAFTAVCLLSGRGPTVIA